MMIRSSLLTFVFVASLTGCLSGPPIASVDAGPVPVADSGTTPADAYVAPTVDSGSGYTWPTCDGRHVVRFRVVVNPTVATMAGNLGPCTDGWRPAALSVAGGTPNVEGSANTLDWTVPAAATGAVRLGFRCGTSTTPEVWQPGLTVGRTAESLGVSIFMTLEGAAEADMSSQVTVVAGGGIGQLQAPLQEMCTAP